MSPRMMGAMLMLLGCTFLFYGGITVVRSSDLLQAAWQLVSAARGGKVVIVAFNARETSSYEIVNPLEKDHQSFIKIGPHGWLAFVIHRWDSQQRTTLRSK